MTVRFRVTCQDVVSEFEFDRDRVTIGRGPANDVVLEDSAVARQHGAFNLLPDGRLVWSCTAPTAVVRAGAEFARSESEEERSWELLDGDIVRIHGAEPIAIEVLTAEAPAAEPRPFFVPLPTTAPTGAAERLVRLAAQLATDPRPDAVLSAFEDLLAAAGANGSGGTSTLVILNGADDYQNDAWKYSADCGCEPAPDPTRLLGRGAAEITDAWRREPCVAVLGTHALIPIGDQSPVALLVFRATDLQTDLLHAVAQAAAPVRPFAQLFVDRMRLRRDAGSMIEENRYFRGRQRQHYLYKELVCESGAMRGVHDRLKTLRNEDRPVLFAGEAGTGKELLARLLHHESSRADQMIMRVNCAEFADETANVELFGASVDESHAGPRQGVFELARHGTVLLEEIDLLPPPVQAKLCRALKENEVRRVGESVGRPIRARLIASVHRDVSECVADGRLRRDLYLLLRDQTIVVPSLRDRREDILPLARNFMNVYAARYGRHLDGFSPEAEARMLNHFWPGNVRELQARVEAAVLGTNGPRIGVGHLGLG